MKKCFIGLGSNECTAARLLAAQSDLRMSFPGIVFSRLVRTAPVAFDSPRMFYNQVACFTTPLTASQVRECLKKIERDHGRTPEDKSRGIVKIDIDLLCYDGELLKPEAWQRGYVREGVAELAFS